ncbi:MAG: porin family protein [Ignavibacteria bacterium]
MTSLKTVFAALFVALFLMTTNNSQAQTYKWEFGPEAGVGIRSVSTDPKDSLTKSSVGFMGGLATQYNISPTVSLKLGVAYERKGADLEANISGTTIKGMINTDYVSIPLLLKVHFGTGKKVRFFVNAGPYLGILLANKTKIDAYGTFPETETDTKDSTKSTDFGLAGGLGVQFLVGTNMGFTIEARDNFGLTNINDSKETTITEIKNNTAQLILGFQWKFGKNPVITKH